MNVHRKIHWFIKSDLLYALIVLLLFAVCLFVFEDTRLDLNIVFSIVVGVFLSLTVTYLRKVLINRLEDSAKLISHEDVVIDKYVNQFLIYDNSNASKDNQRKMKRKLKTETIVNTIPVIIEKYKLGDTIVIDDSFRKYKLPEIIEEHFDELFEAHSSSKTYNQLSIKVDNWYKNNDIFKIHTSRTTYFNSLVSNRAMDYRWENGVTVRDLYEYGPYLNNLDESLLSNHLGANGFVESSDGYIVFVKRNRSVSIGKGTLGSSVGAAIKAKYALDENKQLTIAGIEKAIICEIKDELKVEYEDINDFDYKKHIVSVYRDVIEGGKPQLLFYIKSKNTKFQIEEKFKKIIKSKKRKLKDKLLEDGSKLIWINKKELCESCISSNVIFVKGRKYKTTPSTSASVALLINYLIKSSNNPV